MIKLVLKVVLPVAALGLAALGAREIIRSGPGPKPLPPEDRRPLVRVVEVASRSVRLDVDTYGTVLPRTEIAVVPQVSGLVVAVSPRLEVGAFFPRGEVLLRIERDDYELARTQAESIVAQAKARLDQEEAQAALAREEWKEFGKGSASALALREPQLAEARAMLASAKAKLDRAELDLARTVIRAPMAGRVRTKNVDIGQFVTAGAPVATIYATDHAEVRLAIADEEMGFLDLPLYDPAGRPADPGRPVSLAVSVSGRTWKWEARLVRSEAEVDERTRVAHVRARVEQPYRETVPGRPPLMVGMYVRAHIPGRTVQGVVVLPPGAVRGGDEVLVVDGKDRLHRRKVKVLRTGEEGVIVREGLRAGERVCVTPVEPVVEGMGVRVSGERKP